MYGVVALCMSSTISNAIEYGISVSIGMKFGHSCCIGNDKFYSVSPHKIHPISNTALKVFIFIPMLLLVIMIPQVFAVFGLLGNYDELYYGICYCFF